MQLKLKDPIFICIKKSLTKLFEVGTVFTAGAIYAVWNQLHSTPGTDSVTHATWVTSKLPDIITSNTELSMEEATDRKFQCIRKFLF